VRNRDAEVRPARAPEAAAAQTPELQDRRRFLTAQSVLETVARALEQSDAFDTEITQEVSALRQGLELLDGACDALSDFPKVLEAQS
jgi:hypothetical protein